MKKFFLLGVLLFYSCSNIQKIDTNKLLGPEIPKKGDGYIFKDSIKYEKNSNYTILKNEKEIRFILETRKNDVEEVKIVFSKKEYKMKDIGYIGEKEYYYVDIPNENGLYYFEIKDRKEVLYYGENGIVKKEKNEEVDKYKYNKLDFKKENLNEKYPVWVNKTVWYKLIVDRFNNGNQENDPLFNEFGPNKFLKPTSKLKSKKNKYQLIPKYLWADDTENNLGKFNLSKWNSDYSLLESWEENIKEPWLKLTTKHYGGDIQGIAKKIDYLKNLGVDVLEISPVFYSYSYHKYDTIDYRHVSPDFGVIEETKEYEMYGKSEKVKITTDRSELELLMLKKEITNNLGENLNSESWKWTESDLIFSNFLNKAHQNKIKIVMDIDFMGVSPDFFVFKSVIKKGPQSKYKDWFFFDDWSKVNEYTKKNEDIWNPYIEYKGKSKYKVIYKNKKKYRRKWIEIDSTMPKELQKELLEWNKEHVSCQRIKNRKIKLNFNSEQVKDYLIESAGKWIKGFKGDGSDSLSGYKVYLNSGNMKFYKKFKEEMLKINPAALIILNSTENYEYIDKLIKTFVNDNKKLKLSLVELENYLKLDNLRYSDNKKRIKQLVLDGIYTDRIYSQIINKNREFDKLNKSLYGDNYYEIRPDLLDENVIKQLEQMIFLQIFSSSLPYIYYGTEVGMWGGDIPYNRKPMLWEEEFPYDDESDKIDKYKELKNKLNDKVIYDEVQEKIFYSMKINYEILNWYKKLLKIYKEYGENFSNGELIFLEALEKKEKKESKAENEENKTEKAKNEQEKKEETSQEKATEKQNKDGVEIIKSKDVLAYEFKLEKNSVICLVNNSLEKKTIELKANKKSKYREMFSDENLSVIDKLIEINLEGKSTAIIVKNN